jgi:hypothetical protein
MSQDEAQIIRFVLALVFTVIIPLMLHISLTIYQDDKIKKEDQLKWYDD